MSGFQIIPEDMEAASKAATEAADQARMHSSWGAMTAVRKLQGSDTARFLPELGASWEFEIRVCAMLADNLGTAIAELSADYQSTDDYRRSLLGELGTLLGDLGGPGRVE